MFRKAMILVLLLALNGCFECPNIGGGNTGGTSSTGEDPGPLDPPDAGLPDSETTPPVATRDEDTEDPQPPRIIKKKKKLKKWRCTKKARAKGCQRVIMAFKVDINR